MNQAASAAASVAALFHVGKNHHNRKNDEPDTSHGGAASVQFAGTSDSQVNKRWLEYRDFHVYEKRRSLVVM